MSFFTNLAYFDRLIYFDMVILLGIHDYLLLGNRFYRFFRRVLPNFSHFFRDFVLMYTLVVGYVDFGYVYLLGMEPVRDIKTNVILELTVERIHSLLEDVVVMCQ